MDSTSLTTVSVAEISRLRADKALGEFIGGLEEAQLLEVSGQARSTPGYRSGQALQYAFGLEDRARYPEVPLRQRPLQLYVFA